MRYVGIILLLLVVVSCSSGQKSKQTMPPLPTAKVYGAAEVPSMAEPPKPSIGGIILQWRNAETPFSSNYATGIEATADFQTWQEVTRQPYQSQGSFQVISGNRFEFFRVFNTLRTAP